MRARFNIFPVDGPKNGTAWRPPFFPPRTTGVRKSRTPSSGTERRAFSSFSAAVIFSLATKDPKRRPHRCRQRCTHFLEAHERSRRCAA